MKLDEVRRLPCTQPFRPFVVDLADGGRIAVMHEADVALAPNGLEMIVYQPDRETMPWNSSLLRNCKILPKMAAGNYTSKRNEAQRRVR